jgi:hypothetical protein
MYEHNLEYSTTPVSITPIHNADNKVVFDLYSDKYHIVSKLFLVITVSHDDDVFDFVRLIINDQIVSQYSSDYLRATCNKVFRNNDKIYVNVPFKLSTDVSGWLGLPLSIINNINVAIKFIKQYNVLMLVDYGLIDVKLQERYACNNHILDNKYILRVTKELNNDTRVIKNIILTYFDVYVTNVIMLYLGCEREIIIDFPHHGMINCIIMTLSDNCKYVSLIESANMCHGDRETEFNKFVMLTLNKYYNNIELMENVYYIPFASYNHVTGLILRDKYKLKLHITVPAKFECSDNEEDSSTKLILNVHYIMMNTTKYDVVKKLI